jgi:1-deoxyxylulose-5-phosphate synthase
MDGEMEYRRLGRAGTRVSAIGLGTNNFGRFCDERQSAAVVHRALDLGVNHIDTAESYADGVSEEHIGKALRGRREEAVIATKTGSLMEAEPRLTRGRIMRRLEASLRRLETDHVDLYYLHFPDPSTPIEESLRALEDMVRAGKVLYPAVSNYAAWQVAEMLGLAQLERWTAPVVVQAGYSLVDRGVERELLPAVRRFGMALVPYFPLAGGFLTGKYRRGEPPPEGTRGHGNQRFQQQWLTDANFDRLERYQAFASERGLEVTQLALAWLLSEPAVCSVIAGATRPEQVEANVRAGEWKLSAEDRQAIG